MYALAIVRYRRSIEEIEEKDRQAHREYLRGLKTDSLLIASGPFQPHYGGALLLRIREGNASVALNAIRDNDPFTKLELAQYELLAWDVKTGLEDLDLI